MECFVCSRDIQNGFLCADHAQALKQMLDKRQGMVENPDWRHHCAICMEFEERIVIEYPSAGYFFDRDIRKEWEQVSGKG